MKIWKFTKRTLSCSRSWNSQSQICARATSIIISSSTRDIRQLCPRRANLRRIWFEFLHLGQVGPSPRLETTCRLIGSRMARYPRSSTSAHLESQSHLCHRRPGSPQITQGAHTVIQKWDLPNHRPCQELTGCRLRAGKLVRGFCLTSLRTVRCFNKRLCYPCHKITWKPIRFWQGTAKVQIHMPQAEFATLRLGCREDRSSEAQTPLPCTTIRMLSASCLSRQAVPVNRANCSRQSSGRAVATMIPTFK